MLHLLRDEYRIKRITKVSADTLEELCEKLEGVNAAKALETITAFNAAVKREVPFNPNIKDGRCTVGLPVPKSNWAITIDEPPFEAYAVTCGITFTFGGVKIDTGRARHRYRRASRSPGSMPRARWWAASSTSTIPAAPASPTARCSAASPAPAPAQGRAAATPDGRTAFGW